jgi:hypothetical protein
MAKTYSGGVAVATAFKMNDPQPIVDYMVVELFTDLAALPNQFDGMETFVEENQTKYIKKSTGWEIANASSSNENRLLETTSLELVGNTLTYGADSSRLVQGDEYTNPTDLTTVIAAAPDGFKRVDRVLIGKTNVLTVIPGNLSASKAYPAPYDGSEYAELTFINVDGANFNIVQPDLSVYRKKVEAGIISISHTPSTDIVTIYDKGTYKFVGTKELINNIVNYAFNSPLYEGKEIDFFNEQENPITLKHLHFEDLDEFTTNPLYIPFEFSDAQDYVLQPKERVKLKYMGGMGVFWLVTSNKINNNYSLDEIRTGGTWIDGKPIYRKVIEITTLKGSYTTLDLSSSNIQICISIKGFSTDGADTFHIGQPLVEEGVINASARYLSDGESKLKIGLVVKPILSSLEYTLSGMNFTIILEYTKTTD